MSKKKLLLTAVGLVCTVALLAIPISGCAPVTTTPTTPTVEKATYNWKFGQIHPIGSYRDLTSLDWISRVEEAFDGRMSITYYPGELLGAYKVQAENCSLGTQELYYGSPTSANSPMWNAKQIPTLAKGYEGAFAAFGPGGWAADLHNTFAEDSGWHSYGVIPEGFPGIVSSEVIDVSAPTEKNLKCRGMATEMTRLIIEALGFNYVEMSWSEIHSALTLGTIDAAFGTCGADDYFLFYDVADFAYMYMTHFGQIYLFTNKALYDGLDSEDRAILDRISDKWVVDSWVKWKSYEDARWDELKATGLIEVVDLTTEEWNLHAKVLREKTWPVLEELVGPDIMDIVRASAISID